MNEPEVLAKIIKDQLIIKVMGPKKKRKRGQIIFQCTCHQVGILIGCSTNNILFLSEIPHKNKLKTTLLGLGKKQMKLKEHQLIILYHILEIINHSLKTQQIKIVVG